MREQPLNRAKARSGGKSRKTTITIRDVASHAGVAVGTVSRVLNENSTVEAAIREKVQKSIQELGYKPNALARSMRGLGRSVGIVVSSSTAPLFAEMISEAERVLWDAGYTVTFSSTDGSVDKDIAILDMLTSYRAAGLISAPASEEDARLRAALEEFASPIILWERQLEGFSSVLSDHGGGLRQAMHYLLRQGHRRIALITVPGTVYAGRSRLDVYRTVLRDAGVSPQEDMIVNRGYTAEYGMRETFALFSDRARAPTAIVAGSTQMIGVLRAIRMLGIEVPRQLSLISLGDPDYVELTSPAMTAVRWNARLLGRTSAEALLHRIDQRSSQPSNLPMIPQELVVRESCSNPE